MATPLADVIHLQEAMVVNQTDLKNEAISCSSPILIFLYFHKAIRAELEALHFAAVTFASPNAAGDDSSDDISPLRQRYHFLCSVYRHHCNAEDEVVHSSSIYFFLILGLVRSQWIIHYIYIVSFECIQVIFPALDVRVKNVARTYSLEHEGESALFDHLCLLLNSHHPYSETYRRELASCTKALQTSVSQHMMKEEKQVSQSLHHSFYVVSALDTP